MGKKLFILLVGVMILFGAGSVYPYTTANYPTNFTISQPTSGTSPVYSAVFSFVNNMTKSKVDTIRIINSADSTVFAVVDTSIITKWSGINTTNKLFSFTLTSLQPATTYSFRLVMSPNDTATVLGFYSNAVSFTTPFIPKYSEPDDEYSYLKVEPLKMQRWDSWPLFGISNISFTMVGATDTDSTIYYQPWKYNNVNVISSCAADSINCTLLWYSGTYDFTLSKPKMAFVDSINITSAGVARTGSLGVPVDNGMYFKLRNNTGAGGVSNPQTFTLILNRNRD